ncbi:MAG: hypothetical protein IJY26_00495 [Clostridia bacterium]|nr:hypothetical protein [Clostridia bacterium]
MNGKDNIIANILSKAEEEKAQTLSAAQQKAAAVFESDRAFCAELKEKTLLQCAESEKAALARAVTLANMDVKKLTLQVKQSCLLDVFSAAEKSILSLDGEKYLQFIFSLLDQYAEEGETVVVASADKARVSEEEILSYAKQKGITLSYRADGAFSGGIILESKKYDKNLTVSMLLKEYRESHETEIAAILLGE